MNKSGSKVKPSKLRAFRIPAALDARIQAESKRLGKPLSVVVFAAISRGIRSVK